MKNPFKVGDQKSFEKIVTTVETASFDGNEVHPFYGTFALARDAEWSSRLFVLEMKEDDEEGIGTFVNISHLSPALIGDLVEFTAELKEVKGNNVICKIEAKVGNRIIAEGETGQKIIKRVKLDEIYTKLKKR